MSDASAPAPAAALGDVLLGRYRLERVIGEGGTGVVYAAQDSRTGDIVAIKLLRRALETEELRTRFIREARATGRLAMATEPPITMRIAITIATIGRRMKNLDIRGYLAEKSHLAEATTGAA